MKRQPKARVNTKVAKVSIAKQIIGLALFLLIGILLTTSCVFKESTLEIDGASLTHVDSVQMVDGKLVLVGTRLDGIMAAHLTGPSGVDQSLGISQQSENYAKLYAPSLTEIALNSAISLIITDAHGTTTYSLNFTLVDGVVTSDKLDSAAVTTVKIADGAVTAAKLGAMSASIGQVLKYNGSTWIAGDLGGLVYAGNWDASSNSPDLSGGGSPNEYYYVSVAGSTDLDGIATWAIGDWVVWNDVLAQWEKMENEKSSVYGFNGRQGWVVPTNNDYTWGQINLTSSTLFDLADVNGTSASGYSGGEVLIWDETNSRWDVTTLSAGSGVEITSVDGVVTIATSGTSSIAPDAVNSAEIANSAVGSTELATAAITSAHLTTQVILDSLGSNSITSAHLATGAISGDSILANSITSAQIGSQEVSSTEIKNGTIVGGVGGDIATDTITATEINAGAVGTSEIENESIETGDILNGTITASDLANASVEEAEIATDAVTTIKIIDGAVTAAKLAADSVDTIELVDGAVTTDKLAPGASAYVGNFLQLTPTIPGNETCDNTVVGKVIISTNTNLPCFCAGATSGFIYFSDNSSCL